MACGRPAARRFLVALAALALGTAPLARPGALGAEPEGGAGAPSGDLGGTVESSPLLSGGLASTVYLGLQEAILLAFANSPDLRAAGFIPLRAAEEVASVGGKNDPIAYAKGTYTDTEFPTTTPSITGTQQRLFAAGLGWKQYLETGTYYDIVWDSSYTDLDFGFVTMNPSYRTDFALTVTQPLLKGFGLALNRAPQEIARAGQEAAEIQYRSLAEDLVQRVMETYWDLVLAREIATVKASSHNLARNLAASIEKQVQSGLLAPLELYKAQAVEATRHEEVLLARKAVADVEDLLKSMVSGPGPASLWDREIVPVDRPGEEEVIADEAGGLARALETRDEVRQALAEKRAKVEALRMAANGLLPSFNVLGGVKLNGLSGRPVPSSFEQSCQGAADPDRCEENLGKIFDLFGLTITEPGPEFLGDYFTAYENLDFLAWYVGVSLEYPIGNNTGGAKYRQALMDLDRSESLLASIRDKVRIDVREAVRRVATNRERLATTAAASRLAEKSLRDEQRKFDEGYSTSTLVLTAQKDLAETRTAELKAKADHAKAGIRYQAAVGTLLAESGIQIPAPTVRSFDTPHPLW